MIEYYSTHCGTCETFAWYMESKGIPYVLIDDEAKVRSTANKYHVVAFPFAIINGEFYNSAELLEYVSKYDNGEGDL